MKLIVISASDTLEQETQLIADFFRAGLPTLHLRKPKYSTNRMKKLLSGIPAEFHKRIIIHSHHRLARKFDLKGIHLTKKHKRKKIKTWLTIKWIKMKNPGLVISTSYSRLSSVLDESTIQYDYIFLSPIFDNKNSKYQAGFTEHSLKNVLSKTEKKVIARGGIDTSRIETVKNLGFKGLAVRGDLWTNENPLQEFTMFLNKFKELGLQLE